MLKVDKLRETIILDTSAFISGFDPFAVMVPQFSVPEVRNELSMNSLSRTRLDTAIENGKLEIREPKPEFIERIKTSSKAVGDLLFLSKADRHVLALALELKDIGCIPRIVTDDYSIQNVANQLGIKFAPVVTFGIRYKFHWVMYCPGCYAKYPADYSACHCRMCGTELKRKPSGRSIV